RHRAASSPGGADRLRRRRCARGAARAATGRALHLVAPALRSRSGPCLAAGARDERRARAGLSPDGFRATACSPGWITFYTGMSKIRDALRDLIVELDERPHQDGGVEAHGVMRFGAALEGPPG